MTQYVCDRCETIVIQLYQVVIYESRSSRDSIRRYAELCSGCTNAFEKWVKDGQDA